MNFEIPRTDLHNATLTITRSDDVTEYAFDEHGEVIEDEPDTSLTYFMPTVGREHDGTVPVKKHRAAWESVADALGGIAGRGVSDDSDAAQAIADALALDEGEWIVVDVPDELALRIVRGEVG